MVPGRGPAPANFKIGANRHVVAPDSDGAAPGEAFDGIGFGSVIPSAAAGKIAPSSAQLFATLQLLFGPTAAQLPSAGLSSGYVERSSLRSNSSDSEYPATPSSPSWMNRQKVSEWCRRTKEAQIVDFGRVLFPCFSVEPRLCLCLPLEKSASRSEMTALWWGRRAAHAATSETSPVPRLAAAKSAKDESALVVVTDPAAAGGLVGPNPTLTLSPAFTAAAA